MTDIQKKQIFIGLRDYFKFKNLDAGDAYDELRSKLEKTSSLDMAYIEHLTKLQEDVEIDDVFSNIGNLSFRDCCTCLTYILRLGHWTDDGFEEFLKNGTIYKILVQACKVM